MPVSLESFQNVANASFFGKRDIILRGEGDAQRATLGNLVFSSGQAANDATMAAFRTALEQKYGVFGLHAFDTVLGTRMQLHKSLRASDVKATLSQLQTLKERRFLNELGRQLDTDPQVQEMSKLARNELRTMLRLGAEDHFAEARACNTPEELTQLVSRLIREAVPRAVEQAEANALMAPEDVELQFLQEKPLGERHHVETEVAADQPMGLMRMGRTDFKGWTTSVEDRVKRGAIGVGMRVNRSGNPVLFEKLKTNGVEPGFICRQDWSLDDTRGLMADIFSDENLDKLIEIIDKSPSLKEAQQAGEDVRILGMKAGRAHPAGIAFAAEFVLEQELGKPDSPLAKAFAELCPDLTKEDLFPSDRATLNEQHSINLKRAKRALFAPLRDAVMNYGKSGGPYSDLPIFRHFTDRHIVKLDYNEGDRAIQRQAAHAGKFRLPERTSIKGGAFKGFFFRNFRLTSADSASAGAVSEALANDLTRLMGVPAQELSLVRGEYSDGHPKLMLSAKFASGYRDLEYGFLKDGQAVTPTGEPPVEPLGKYKALFLALADRDAVGSHGQNKGIVNGHFFAIDPGHSLEGNGKDLVISDDLSFRDTGANILEKRFRNFSVFDDDTRFAKLQGVLKLRELMGGGRVGTLFNDYRRQFDPNETGISAEEKKLRQQIQENINQMQTEFTDQITKITTACKAQLDLYDALEGDGPQMQEQAINTIENLEKLTSPTTWTSPHGEVQLKHLAVLPETRVAWTAEVRGDNLIYRCDKPLDAEARQRLGNLAAKANVVFGIGANGSAVITVAKADAAQFFETFSEQHVAELTHPDEAAARSAE